MNRQNQRVRVLQHLKEHGSISQEEADEIKVKRLSARIMELREAGNNIKCVMIPGRNEYGPYRYGRYYLEA